MTTAADDLTWELVLQAVRTVPGVSNAEVDSTASGQALRLDLTDGAAEDAVRRAVDTVLDERFGVAADVAGTRETTGPFVADEGRLRADRLIVTRFPDRSVVEVVLRLDEGSASGSKSGAALDDEPRAVAEAVLLALEELTEDAVIGTIEELGFPDGGETASVRLGLDVDGTAVSASGSAAVLNSPTQAVLRAVLAAVEPHLPD